jgi:hypothetical protein
MMILSIQTLNLNSRVTVLDEKAPSFTAMAKAFKWANLYVDPPFDVGSEYDTATSDVIGGSSSNLSESDSTLLGIASAFWTGGGDGDSDGGSDGGSTGDGDSSSTDIGTRRLHILTAILPDFGADAAMQHFFRRLQSRAKGGSGSVNDLELEAEAEGNSTVASNVCVPTGQNLTQAKARAQALALAQIAGSNGTQSNTSKAAASDLTETVPKRCNTALVHTMYYNTK